MPLMQRPHGGHKSYRFIIFPKILDKVFQIHRLFDKEHIDYFKIIDLWQKIRTFAAVERLNLLLKQVG